MRKIRGTDMVWLFFLGALAALVVTKPEHSVYEWLVLLALGALQIAEAHLELSSDRIGAPLVIALKLAGLLSNSCISILISFSEL